MALAGVDRELGAAIRQRGGLNVWPDDGRWKLRLELDKDLALIGRHSRDVHQARVGSLLEDGIDLEADRHLGADRDAAAVHRDADVDAEFAPVDLRGRGEAEPAACPTGPGRTRSPRGQRQNEQIATVAVDLYRSEGWASRTDKA
jgi:hypothetical protein